MQAYKFWHVCSYSAGAHACHVCLIYASANKKRILIPFDDYSMCYQKVDDTIKLIQISGSNSWLTKANITLAFKVIILPILFLELGPLPSTFTCQVFTFFFYK